MIQSQYPLKRPFLKPKSFTPNPVAKFGVPAYADSILNRKVVGTPAWKQWWEEQLYYIINGYETAGVFIPGRYYYYLNFCKTNSVKGGGSYYPSYIDFQYEYFLLVEEAKKLGKNIIIPKGRRKGMSVMSTAVVDYGWRFIHDYRVGVVAGKKEYSEDFLDKWIYLDSLIVPEFRTRKLSKTYDDIIAGWSEKDEVGSWANYGTQNKMYCRTAFSDPEIFKGKFLNDVIFEEAGEFDNFIKTIQATEACLKDGNVQYGTGYYYGCVCKGTKVWTNDGNLINIEDLVPENGILGFNGEGYSKEEITYWQPPKEKVCYKITTNTGRTLECSEDHPILWSNRNAVYSKELPSVNGKRRKAKTKKVVFKEAMNICVNDQIAVIDSVDLFGSKKMWEPRLIGWLIGDGTYGIDHSPRMSNCDAEINNHLLRNFDAKVTKSHITKEGKIYEEIRLKGICHQLRDIGTYGQTKLNKRLPVNVNLYSKEDVLELLGGIFDTDGCVCVSNGWMCISLTSSCFELLDEVRFLLQKLGVHGQMSRIKADKKNPKSKNDYYKISINDKRSLIAFHKNISFSIKYKQDNLNRVFELYKDRPERKAKGVDGIRLERVVSVENIGMKPVYNLTAGTTNTYIANGVVTHNTGGNIRTGSKGFEEVWHNYESYNCLRYFVDGPKYFSPCFVGATGKGGVLIEDIPNLLQFGKEERFGMEDEVRAKEIIEAEKKKLLKNNKDLKKYWEYCKDNPTDIKEVFRKSASNNFPVDILNDQQYKLLSEDKKYSMWKLSFVTDPSGVIKTPYEVIATPAKEDTPEDECVLILNTGHPVAGMRNLDVAGADSYDQDLAMTSSSLGSMVVLRRDHNIQDQDRMTPVCLIRCRPKRREQFYEMCLMVSIYYDLKYNTLIDVGKPAIIDYYKQRGCAIYLAKRPIKFESEKSEQNHEYGFAITSHSKPIMLGLLQSYFCDHADKIWFNVLLDEALSYDEGSRTSESDKDAVDALGIALVQLNAQNTGVINDNERKKRDPYAFPEYQEDGNGNMIPVSKVDVSRYHVKNKELTDEQLWERKIEMDMLRENLREEDDDDY